MRDKFPEYYYEPDETTLWKKAAFVLDTNVLLDVFRFSPGASKGLVKILKHLNSHNRLWMPYQFANEYMRNVPRIRKKIKKRYDDDVKTLDKYSQLIVNVLNSLNKQTDYELEEQITSFKETIKTVRNGLSSHRKDHKRRLDSKALEKTVEKLLLGNVGTPFSDKRLARVMIEGSWRYRLQRPPSFKDSHKPEARRYGDLIGWLQTVRFAKKDKSRRPVVLVTRDGSDEDWFYKPNQDGTTTGPRPELVKEMKEKAGVDFYLYETWQFMELANTYLELDERVSETAVSEARSRSRRLVAGHTPIDLLVKDAAASAEAIRTTFMSGADTARALNEVLRANAAENARIIEAIRRPIISSAHAEAARSLAQVFTGIPVDTGLIYGLGSPQSRLSDPDEEEVWDDELDSDDQSGYDANIDDDPDDPDQTPTPEET